MYKIENLGNNEFFIKAMGLFPPSVAKEFSEEFLEIIQNLEKIKVIVDLSAISFIKLDSIDIVLDLFKKTENKLNKSAFIVVQNPPLSEEVKYVLQKAKSHNRKVVKNLHQAKLWTGIKNLMIGKST